MDFPYDETKVSLARNYCFTAKKLLFPCRGKFVFPAGGLFFFS